MSEKEGPDETSGFGPPIDTVAFRTAPPPPAQNYVAPPPPQRSHEDNFDDTSRSQGDESFRGKPPKPGGIPPPSPDAESRSVGCESGSSSGDLSCRRLGSSGDVSCRRLNSGGSNGSSSSNNDGSFRRVDSGGSSSASGVGVGGDASCKRIGSGNSTSASSSGGDSSCKRLGSGGSSSVSSSNHNNHDSSSSVSSSNHNNHSSSSGDSSCKRLGSGSSSVSTVTADGSCRRVNSGGGGSVVGNLNIPIPLTPVGSPSSTPTFINTPTPTASTTPPSTVHIDCNITNSHISDVHSNNPHTLRNAAPPPPLTPTTPTAPINIITTTPNHRRSPTPIHVFNATELHNSFSASNNESTLTIDNLFFEEDFAGMGRLKRPSWQPPPKPPGFPAKAEADKVSVISEVAINEQEQHDQEQEQVKNLDPKSPIPPPPISPPPPAHAPREKRQSIIERLLGTAERKAAERDALMVPKSLPIDKLTASGRLEVDVIEDTPIDDGALSFVHFPHIFDSILAQVNGGLHVVKRTVSYLKKLVTIQEQFVLECEKVNHLELSKQDTLKKEDQMLGFLELAVSVRGNMESMIKRHKHFGLQLSSGVIRPLEAFIKDSDASCTKLVQGYERAALTVAQHTAEMEKQRQVCLKEWDELGEAALAEKAKPQGVAKKKVQTKKAFTRFEELKALAMPARYQFVHVTRPHLLRKFEALEIARMEILQAAMTEFAKAQAAFWGTEVSLPQLDSGSLSAAAVLADTMARWLRQHGSAPATQLSPSQLPCTPEALDTEAWREFIILPQPGEEDEEEEEAPTPSQGRAATGLASMLRGVVSKKKKRFQEGGFDLDLSYITPRIIAMGFPAESITGLYRNNMVDVQKFMTTRHPGNVHVYNLCAEMSYDPQKFEGQVSCFPFFDHNPCPLNMILPFCLHVHDWLLKDPSHVVAVHCKAGKGRTGFMIACYLLYSGLCGSAAEALEFYALKRTKDSKGVTIPSQIRYVSYFEQLLGSIGWLERPHPPLPVRNVLFLKSVTLRGIPYAYSACPEQLSFVVVDPNKKHDDGTYRTVFSSKGMLQPHADLAQDCVLFSADTAPCIVELCDDFKVVFSGGSKLFSLWANTRVVQEVVPLSFHPPYKLPTGVLSSDDPFRVAPKDARPVKIIVCPSCGHERPLEDDGRSLTEEDTSELCGTCKSAMMESDASCSRNNPDMFEETTNNDDASNTNNSDQRGKVFEERARLEKSKDWKEVATQLKREAEQAAKVQTAYRLVMGKQDLDKAVKDKKHLLFPAYMTVELLFHEVHRLESDAKANSALPSLATSPHPLPSLTARSPAPIASSTTRQGRANSSSASTASSFLSHVRSSSLSVTSPSPSKSSLFSSSPRVASNLMAPTASVTSFSAPSKSDDLLY